MSSLRSSLAAALTLCLVTACGGDDDDDANANRDSRAGDTGSTTGGSGSGGAGNRSGGGNDGDSPGAAGAGATGQAGSGDGTGDAAGYEQVEMQVGDCSDVSGCGGDVEGTWEYVSGCLNPDELVNMQALTLVCPAADFDLEVTIGGMLTFTKDEVSRTGGWVADGELTIPESCSLSLDALGGCAAVPQTLTTLRSDVDAACEPSGSDCVCTIGLSGGDWETTGYTVSGKTLTLENGRTFSVCVEGDGLSYQETGDDPAEPGSYGLGRR